MDSEDQNDIIKKIKNAGENDKDTENTPNDNNDNSTDDNTPSDSGNSNDANMGVDVPSDNGEKDVKEAEKKEDFLLNNPKKLSIFAPERSKEAKESYKDTWDPYNIKVKLAETFNQENMTEPTTKPVVKPAPTKTPAPTQPSRKNKPFLPSPSVQPAPKAMKEIEKDIKGSEKPAQDDSVLSNELASISKNEKDLIIKQHGFFNNKEVDPKSITKIIFQAAEIIKNR